MSSRLLCMPGWLEFDLSLCDSQSMSPALKSPPRMMVQLGLFFVLLRTWSRLASSWLSWPAPPPPLVVCRMNPHAESYDSLGSLTPKLFSSCYHTRRKGFWSRFSNFMKMDTLRFVVNASSRNRLVRSSYS